MKFEKINGYRSKKNIDLFVSWQSIMNSWSVLQPNNVLIKLSIFNYLEITTSLEFPKHPLISFLKQGQKLSKNVIHCCQKMLP